ncbi:MAG: TetR family transcriptional regulator [Deltaproteobacteria bacterium]|nr:TetR family transcriptional regulator [Deltaproteobacteria bacterium]
MATRDTRSEIIRAGLGIMARQGFNSTGIDAVLKRAKVPKGSFYHYFSSKQEFGLHVLDHFADGIDRIFTSFLSDESATPLTRMRNCVESLVARFEENNCSIGCIAANLGQEMADQSEEFRAKLADIFRSWIRHFEQCLGEARDAGEIRDDLSPAYAAECFLSGFEGALLVSKVMKSSLPLKNFITIYFDRVLQ